MTATELQRLVFPEPGCFGSELSYFRKTGGYYCPDSRAFRFFRALEFNTFTFYNAFTVGKWRRHTAVDSLILRLKGRGKVILQIMLASRDTSNRGINGNRAELDNRPHKTTELWRQELQLNPDDGSDIEIEPLSDIPDGLIYFQLIPLEDGVLTYSGYFTVTAPVRPVKLGLIITHFNRPQDVVSAASRIEQGVLSDRECSGDVHLYVVDNSRNSGLASTDRMSVIENQNYGGSGGFARGLLALADQGSYTHCLFMDDDASCEAEALRRTYKLLMYATDEKFAVAGALLHKEAPSRLYEKGAVFDGVCRKIHPDLDIGSESGLLLAEEQTVRPNYGGWWFFAFSIKDAHSYPFPFFVRGDDTSFGMVNDFNILTMNGIASYGETFEAKHGALQTYLDTRGHLVKQIALLGHGRLRVAKGFARFFLISLLSYNYGSTRAVILAFRDLMQGPDFFVENLDMQSRLKELAQLSQKERLLPVEGGYSGVDFVDVSEENAARKLLRYLTFNGALLPAVLMKRRSVFQQKALKAVFKETFGYNDIYYEHSPSMTGYIASYDRKEFLAANWQFALCLLRLSLDFGPIQSRYRKRLPQIMSHDFWKSVYPDEHR